MSKQMRSFAIVTAVVVLAFGAYFGYAIKKCERCPVPDYNKVDSLTQVSAQIQAQNAVLSADIQALKDSLAKWPKRKPTKQRIEHEERAFRSAGLDSAALYLLSDPE